MSTKHISKGLDYSQIIQCANFSDQKVRGANAPLLLAPAEGLGPSGPTGGPLGPAGGPSGPAVGLRPPALELKLIYTLILW